jgi:hypothetical protein
MKNLITLIILALIFVGCSSIGTKTLFRAQKNNILIKKIGVINLVPDSINTKICPTINAMSESAIKESFLYSKEFEFSFLDSSKGFYNISLNKNSLTELSNKNNLDAILLVGLKFINVNYTVAFIPVTSEFHSESIVSLYNNLGDKLITISHNTSRGDNYIERPTPEITVNDAIQIATKKLLDITKKLNDKLES